MKANFIFTLARRITKLPIFSVVLLILFCNSANAILINFDDLDPAAFVDANGELVFVSKEYEAQGLIISGSAYLIEWSQWNTPASLPNYLVGPGFSLGFIGDLPNYVSFKVGSSTGSAVAIDAVGPNFARYAISSGEIHGMTDDNGTPYIPNEVFSFFSSTGISSISFSGQSDAYIDDLIYTYSDATVPEPTGIILLGIGFLGLALRGLKAVIK
jgi:hypothetical protein